MLSKHIDLQTLVLLGVVVNQDKALEMKDGEQNSPKHKNVIFLGFFHPSRSLLGIQFVRTDCHCCRSDGSSLKTFSFICLSRIVVSVSLSLLCVMSVSLSPSVFHFSL